MNKRAMIVIFSVVIAVLIGIMIWEISAHSSWNNFSAGSSPVSRAGLSPGVAFEFAAADVRELDVDLLSEAVRIETGDGDKVVVEQTASRDIPSRDQIFCGLRGGILTVQSPVSGVYSCGPDVRVSSEVVVRIPESLRAAANVETMSGRIQAASLQFTDLSMQSASGSISLQNVTARETDLETMSGDIDVADCRLEALESEAASGSIQVEGDVAQTVQFESASGAQYFRGTAGDFSASSASGDIRAELEGTAGIRAETMSGTVEVTCPDASRLQQIEAETASGSVRIGVPRGTALQLNFESGSGTLSLDEAGGIRIGSGIAVDVETMSGDLSVRGLA
ncbi:MAG: DUF4097 domain-containing protein [Clostridia bacterium]|nr:DUF4097 domain-containing protein [Clostridia bacterium]